MGNAPTCSACCTDLSRGLPLAHTVSEAHFAHAELVDRDVVPALSKGALAAVTLPPGRQQGCPCPATVDGVAASISASTTNTARQSEDGSCNNSAAASESTAASRTPDVGKAQHVVKSFVRSFVKGKTVSVLTVNGGTRECIASLDRKLTTLSLQQSGKKDAKKRGVPLHGISEIRCGEEAGEDIDLPLDENCVTLLLEDGSAVGFRFADIEERDTFALCLSMFVDGRRGEEDHQKKQKV